MNFLFVGEGRDIQYAGLVKGCVPPEHQVVIKSTRTNYLYDITAAITAAQAKYQIHIHGIILSDPGVSSP